MTSPKAHDEIQVTLEDQKKINRFARKNATLSELRGEIEDVKKQLQNAEDASDDLMLLDDEESISFQIGEVFIDHGMEDTQELLEKSKSDFSSKIAALEKECGDIMHEMKELKVQLYAKFGDNINLEP